MELMELWAIFGHDVSGAVFGAAWWIWLDAVVCSSATVPFLHYLPDKCFRVAVSLAVTACEVSLAVTACVLVVGKRVRGRKVVNVLRELEEGCDTRVERLKQVVDAMAVEIHAGLASEGGSKLKMLLTFVDNLPNGASYRPLIANRNNRATDNVKKWAETKAKTWGEYHGS